MTVHAQAIEFFAVPISYPLTMYTGLPVLKNSTMTLAAKIVRLLKIDPLFI